MAVPADEPESLHITTSPTILRDESTSRYYSTSALPNSSGTTASSLYGVPFSQSPVDCSFSNQSPLSSPLTPAGTEAGVRQTFASHVPGLPTPSPRAEISLDHDYSQISYRWTHAVALHNQCGKAEESLKVHHDLLSRLGADEYANARAQVWFNIGAIRCGQKKYALAVTAFEESVRIAPSLVISHYGKGTCAYDLTELEAAKASFDECLALFPESASSIEYNEQHNVFRLNRTEVKWNLAKCEPKQSVNERLRCLNRLNSTALFDDPFGSRTNSSKTSLESTKPRASGGGPKAFRKKKLSFPKDKSQDDLNSGPTAAQRCRASLSKPLPNLPSAGLSSSNNCHNREDLGGVSLMRGVERAEHHQSTNCADAFLRSANTCYEAPQAPSAPPSSRSCSDSSFSGTLRKAASKLSLRRFSGSKSGNQEDVALHSPESPPPIPRRFEISAPTDLHRNGQRAPSVSSAQSPLSVQHPHVNNPANDSSSPVVTLANAGNGYFPSNTKATTRKHLRTEAGVWKNLNGPGNASLSTVHRPAALFSVAPTSSDAYPPSDRESQSTSSASTITTATARNEAHRALTGDDMVGFVNPRAVATSSSATDNYNSNDHHPPVNRRLYPAHPNNESSTTVSTAYIFGFGEAIGWSTEQQHNQLESVEEEVNHDIEATRIYSQHEGAAPNEEWVDAEVDEEPIYNEATTAFETSISDHLGYTW